MAFGTGDYRREAEQQSRGNSVKRRGNSQMGRISPEGPWRASGVRCAAALLFATEAQGRAHQDETREIIYENTRLQVVSEGKPRLERAVDGAYFDQLDAQCVTYWIRGQRLYGAMLPFFWKGSSLLLRSVCALRKNMGPIAVRS